VSAVELLSEIGGVATRASLIRMTSRAEVDRLVASGDLVVDARGRYALPTADEALRAAHRLCGVRSHLSAAMAWGWEVKTPPPRPQVTLDRRRRLTRAQRRGVALHWADLGVDDVTDNRTSVERTLADCLRSLPFDEALAVADSALRHGDITPQGLARLGRASRGPGSRSIRRVAAAANGLATNPFESVLRAIALEVPGLTVRPQVAIGDRGFLGRPDLVDVELRIVLEADSFAWHGDKLALESDARRYNSFVVAGWLVLRFTWQDVMRHPDRVREVLVAAVTRRTQQPRCRRCPA